MQNIKVKSRKINKLTLVFIRNNSQPSHNYLVFLVSEASTHLGLLKELKSEEFLPYDEISGSY